MTQQTQQTQIADVIPLYIRLRDHISERETQMKEEIRPLKEKLERLDAWMLEELDKRGEDSVAIRGIGTVYKKKENRCSVADWGATWTWITEHNRYDLLNHAVNKTVVVAHVEETGEIPPGLNFTSTFTVAVNRARGT